MLFTWESYRRMIKTAADCGFAVYGIEEILAARRENRLPSPPYLAIRHDVDYFPKRALALAELEAGMNIAVTYYFRRRFFEQNIDLIRRIAAYGHQVGYHYEEVDTHQKAPNLQVERDAVGFFIGALLDLDRLGFPIRSVCAHGNPLTDVDNRLVVQLARDEKELDRIAFTYDRREIKEKVTGRLIGDALIDISGKDFDLYLPDTGRFNPRFNLKDRLEDCPIGRLRRFSDFEKLVRDGRHQRIYLNLHPDRWSGSLFLWLFDFAFDTAKNAVKLVWGKSAYRGKMIGDKARRQHAATLKSLGDRPDDRPGTGS